MSEIRCKPHNLHVGTPVQYGQSMTYHDSRPLEDMLRKTFWQNISRGEKHDRLRAGDTLRICQTIVPDTEESLSMVEVLRRMEVFAYIDVTIMRVDKEGPHLIADGPIRTMDEEDIEHAFKIKPEEDEKVEVVVKIPDSINHAGAGSWQVLDADGVEICRFNKVNGGQAMAQSVLDRKTPVPMPDASQAA